MHIDKELLTRLHNIKGRKLLGIKYGQSEFKFQEPNETNGDWSLVPTNSMVIHSPEWQFILDKGEIIYFKFDSLDKYGYSFGIDVLHNSSFEGNVLTVPNNYHWNNILNNEITGFAIWKTLTSRNFLGVFKRTTHEPNFKVIQFKIGKSHIYLTALTGDIGESYFYQTGSFGDSIGVFFNKTIVTEYKGTLELMRIERVYDSW